MDAVQPLLDTLQQETSHPKLEKCIDQLIKLVEEGYKDDEDEVQKAIVDSAAFASAVPPLLSGAEDHPTLTARAAQLVAELAKAEAVRVPLVNLGLVPPLLILIQPEAKGTAEIATQVCRALGNVCFDNDVGRKAVDEGDGLTLSIQLIEKFTKSTESGADRVRVLCCGFILNLTNECDWLADKAVESGALTVLDSVLRDNPDQEDLYHMAIAAFLRITDSDVAKSDKWINVVVRTLVWVVSRENTGSPLIPVLEELNIISEMDAMKGQLADSELPDHLPHIIQHNTGLQSKINAMKGQLAESELPDHLLRIIQHNTDLLAKESEGSDGHGTQDAEECIKTASDLLLSLLVGEGSMETLYGGGEGAVFKQCVQWMTSEVDSLRVLAALSVGNFARSDAHCRQLVDSGIVESLLTLLKVTLVEGKDVNFTLQHAVLSSLRNLAIPTSNKGRLLELGVMAAVLELKHTEVMAVTFKLLGVLRMLIDGQESAATTLGQDKDFLNCLVDWCAVEEHAGVKGEATRCMSWLIKNSRTSQVMRNLVRAEGMQHLVSMGTSEHLVMQNEALVALNLVAATVLGEAAVSLKEAGLTDMVLRILKKGDAQPELLCNTLTLVRSLATAASPTTSPSLPCSLLACAGLMPDTLNILKQDLMGSGAMDVIRLLSTEHAHQGVKDAATAALAALEEEVNR